MVSYVLYLIVGFLMAVELWGSPLCYFWVSVFVLDMICSVIAYINIKVKKRKEYLKRDILHQPKSLFDKFLDMFIDVETKDVRYYTGKEWKS